MKSWPGAFSYVLMAAGIAAAGDWPQWMGPNRDGVWAETKTLDSFPAHGPEKLWSVKVEGGYSGPAVAAGKVFLTDYAIKDGTVKNNPSAKIKLSGQERLHCIDEKTGQVSWSQAYDCDYAVSYPCGPRCTPTVDGELVYTVGSMGHLQCRRTSDGSLVWSKSFVKDYQAETPIWGFSGHPLVYGDLLICLVGGKDSLLVAFDKTTGTEKWKALNAREPGYSSPRVFTIGGSEQLVIWYPNSMAGLEPKTGKVLWQSELAPSYGMTIMTPQQHGDFLFAGGIGNAAADIEVTAKGAKVAWKGTRETALYPVNMTPLVKDNILYGCDQPGAFRAVDLKTGKRLWSTMLPVLGKDVAETNVGSGTAFLVRNGDKYFLFSETGHLIIAKLSPRGYQELARHQIVEPTGEAFGRKVVWSHPAFANGHVFARNDRELVSYRLTK